MEKCELCGEPMPPGEEMFKIHGYSGVCPKPPLERESALETYLRDGMERGIIDHQIRCTNDNGMVTFYIHPEGKDGDTADFAVFENQLHRNPRVSKG